MVFDSPWNKMIMTGNETDLHYKVVDLIRRYYPDTILVAGLGENQDTEDKRLDSYKEGYMKGQPDLMILDKHKDFKGLCPGGGYFRNFWVGMCRWDPGTLNLYQS